LRWGQVRVFACLALVLLVGVQAAEVDVISTARAAEDDHPIVARNAVVIDASTGQVLFERNMDASVAPASLTKIFTTIVALESAALDTRMTVDSYDLVGEASIGLRESEDVSLETLTYGLMLSSGNDAAMTVARSLGSLPGDSPQESVNRFMERVNSTANRLGLRKTTLRNPHGLDQDGHLSSARDIAAISMYALRNPIFESIISTPYYGGDGKELYNVNRLLDAYPGLVGGKTGVTSRAGYCLMQVAQRNGHTVIVVLLGSTADSWYADAEYLLDLGFTELVENPDDDMRPVVSLAGRVFEVPDVAMPEGVGGNLRIDRLSDNEAVVRQASPVERDDPLSWRWPVVSL
jgi:serine-type D-Ala-D-Ala carboxypeptidase (penicillin-binding protein 5/6)